MVKVSHPLEKIIKYYLNVIVGYFPGKNVQRYILGACILKKCFLFHLAVIPHITKTILRKIFSKTSDMYMYKCIYI